MCWLIRYACGLDLTCLPVCSFCRLTCHKLYILPVAGGGRRIMNEKSYAFYNWLGLPIILAEGLFQYINYEFCDWNIFHQSVFSPFQWKIIIFGPDVNTSNNNEMCLFNKTFCSIHIRHKGDLKRKLFNWEMTCIPIKHLCSG